MAYTIGYDPDFCRRGGGRPPAPRPAWDLPERWAGAGGSPAPAAVVDPVVLAPGDRRLRAALYLRMSTDHQEYSPANQRDALERYARAHGLEIVRTYSDEGRSGLSVQGREGLAALLGDVVGGRADFGVVLVYDVSRWGRFQDADESAHYEYLCRRCGIRVEYCMEPFANDGSPMCSVVKGLKRVMAAEYSRELSAKVFVGKCRMIRMGYHQGAVAGFGLRRMVVDAAGRPRCVLEPGERKYVQSDRVILVPGPAEEVAEVRLMFERIADQRWTAIGVARDLNARGVLSHRGRPWNRDLVLQVVENEKYIGNLVYNRRSMKLKSPVRDNPPEQWVRRDGAFEAVIDPALFRRAQETMAGWSTRIGNTLAIEKLRALHRRRGRLSAALIDAEEGMPGSVFYAQRFGGLYRAYQLAGYEPTRDWSYIEGNSARLRRLAALRAEVRAGLEARGVAAEWESKAVLRVAARLRVAVMLARCQVVGGRAKWTVQPHANPDWVLTERLDQNNEAMDYWVIRGGSHYAQIGARHRRQRERHQAPDLAGALELVAVKAEGRLEVRGS